LGRVCDHADSYVDWMPDRWRRNFVGSSVCPKRCAFFFFFGPLPIYLVFMPVTITYYDLFRRRWCWLLVAACRKQVIPIIGRRFKSPAGTGYICPE